MLRILPIFEPNWLVIFATESASRIKTHCYKIGPGFLDCYKIRRRTKLSCYASTSKVLCKHNNLQTLKCKREICKRSLNWFNISLRRTSIDSKQAALLQYHKNFHMVTLYLAVTFILKAMCFMR